MHDYYLKLPGGVQSVAATTPIFSSGGVNPNITIQVANATQNGYLSSSDWNTFNNKQSREQSDYITNPNAETDTVGWNTYNNSGRTDPAFVVAQDITFISVAQGGTGNGINIQYVFQPTQSYTNPLITVVSPTLITAGWYNGPTVSNNPSATQLKNAYDSVPAAVAIATCSITGVATNLQYITGSNIMAGGGDVYPVDGTGGSVTGIALTRNTISPLIGIASFDLSKDASARQGEGISTDFVINSVDENNTLQISFVYSGSTNMTLGSGSDIQVFIYDIGNSNLIPVLPTAVIPGPVNTAKTFVGTFETTNSSNYRLILHIATTNTQPWDFLLDSVTVNDLVSPTAVTEVESLVLRNQPLSGAVTDHMVVMWTDGASHWVPATISGACLPVYGDDKTQLGFVTNIIGSTGDIYIRGAMSGFSFGPFTGYAWYIDNIAGGISPLPSPFTDLYCIVGTAIDTTTLNIQFETHVDLISNSSGVPQKGGLLSSSAVNDGTGDLVLPVGANGNVLVANSGAALGINWAAAVVASAPFTYTTATRTLTIATATNAVSGVLSAADHTTFAAYATNKQSATLTNTHILVGNASNIATDVAMSGDVSITNTGATSIAATVVTGKLVTGFVSGAGTVAATDTILQVINKVVGNIALKAPLAGPVFTGDVNSSTGNVLVSTIGKTIAIKTGANSKIGQATLVAGTVTVANTSITANSRIFLTVSTAGGTQGFLKTTKTIGTNFIINSTSAAETSVIDWLIVESL